MKVGICPAKLTVPSSSADPVNRKTSQLVAIRVIQVPMSEMLWPPKKRRKFLCLSARHACDTPDPSTGSSRALSSLVFKGTLFPAEFACVCLSEVLLAGPLC
jgi:hypothetical protein